MWILESSSELFQGRRMWLKPGKQYLFGRVKKDGVRFAIDNKTISRKHFIIKIEEPRSEDVGNIHARTRATIEDQNSKAGTTVNGEHIKNASRELQNAENYIKPGTLPEELVIRWCPCILTYNLLKKEVKAGVLKAKQERLRDLDVKVISEYVAGQTTYLVVNKRNTPKSLQALIDGRHLVAESYVDALEYAATPSDLNEEENLSPLEQDFESAWPDPCEHLPPPGRELTTRPAESYKPNSQRKNVFSNFTFVFVDQTQYDNLLPPITAGHGKAVLYTVTSGETKSSDLVAYLRNIAGKKGFGDHRRSTDKGGVILVRFKGGSGDEDWMLSLINETALALDQRAIDQGEFLDAILANQGMLLRQAVPYESNSDGLIAPPATASPPKLVGHRNRDHDAQARLSRFQPIENNNNDPAHLNPPQPNSRLPSDMDGPQTRSLSVSEASQASLGETQRSTGGDDTVQSTKRARFTVPKKSRVIDFDDDFDPDLVAPYEGEDEQISADAISQSQRQSTPLSSLADGDLNGVKNEPTSSRKRPRSPSGDTAGDLDNDMDDLLPAAAAMKRRKLALAARNGTSTQLTNVKPISALTRRPKKEKEIDVRELAKAQRKVQEDKAQKEQDELEEDLRLEPGQKLPVYDVETVLVDVPVRKQPATETNGESSDRWDPKWNGRKNFKGFRRARDKADGESGEDARQRRHTRVIVPLVEAQTATYGIGDQYWDKTQEEKERDRERRRKASQRTTQSDSNHTRSSPVEQSRTVGDSDEGDHEADAAGDRDPQLSSQVARLQDEAAEIVERALNINEPRRTRLADSQAANEISTGHKRPATSTGRAGAPKKQKTLPVTVIHGSDSDGDSDDMKFKFGSHSRRGRGRGRGRA